MSAGQVKLKAFADSGSGGSRGNTGTDRNIVGASRKEKEGSSKGSGSKGSGSKGSGAGHDDSPGDDEAGNSRGHKSKTTRMLLQNTEVSKQGHMRVREIRKLLDAQVTKNFVDNKGVPRTLQYAKKHQATASTTLDMLSRCSMLACNPSQQPAM